MENIDKSIFAYLGRTRPTAYAEISDGEKAPNLKGIAQFYAFGDGTIVVTSVKGLPQTNTNIFAEHIHEGSECGDNFEKTGGHFNPTGEEHPLHAGDMPPLFSNGGVAFSVFYTQRFSVKDVVGRVVVIHDGPDDFVSQPAGNSGEKIACGKIQPYPVMTAFWRK